MADDKALTPFDSSAIEAAILTIRGKRVMLDADLARFYGIPTKALNQQVKRNTDRFPADFVFQLTAKETDEVNRSQNVTASRKHRDPRFPPYAFTEHGALAVVGVIKSARAAKVSVVITRAFLKMRDVLIQNLEMANKLIELEAKVGRHDRVLQQLVDAARQFIQDNAKLKAQIKGRREQAPTRRRAGFRHDD